MSQRSHLLSCNTSIFNYLDEIKLFNIFIIEDSNFAMLTSTIEVCIHI
jgi:hypothetical protein